MRVIAGPEKKTRVMGEKERLVTAYHEMGHAMVAHFLQQHRPGAQDLDHLARPGARLHDLAADRGQVPDHARGAVGPARDDPRRTRRRGDRLQRDHDRRRERPREGDRDRQADGHALRHVREARAAHLRARPVPALPRSRVQRDRRLLGGDRARDRRRDPPHRRGGAPDRAPGAGRPPRAPRPSLAGCCSSTRRSSARSSRHCWPASPRKRSSGRPSRSTSLPPHRRWSPPGARSPSRARCRTPRPGLAGGTAEMREKPELPSQSPRTSASWSPTVGP